MTSNNNGGSEGVQNLIDTSLTKVFVDDLAWETPKEAMESISINTARFSKPLSSLTNSLAD
ncbi:hypothetical protein ACS0TY_035831 [Phlomoides rotata]